MLDPRAYALAFGRLVPKIIVQVFLSGVAKFQVESHLILLSSSEPQGMCYIETANLDGETNLKIRSSLLATSQIIEGTELSQMYGTVEAEAPNRRLYEFAGNISLMGRGRWASKLSIISSLFSTKHLFAGMLSLFPRINCC